MQGIDKGNSANKSRLFESTLFLAVLSVGVILSFSNFLLFHTSTEFFSISIAFAAYMVLLINPRENKSNYTTFIGYSFFFVAIIDLLHAITYKGMNIIPSLTANTPTQLWISARYLQSISLLAANYYHNKPINKTNVNVIYSVAVIGIFTSIFVFPIFPVCYVEGQGLTQFKILSEYLISLIFIASLGVLYRNRAQYSPSFMRGLGSAIVLTIFSEIAFTLYVSVYGITNLIGHIFKVLASYMIYNGVVRVAVKDPFDNIYRSLAQSEEQFREFMQSATDGFLFMDNELRIVDVNEMWLSETGKTREVIGRLLGDVFPVSVESERRYDAYRKVVETGEPVEFRKVQSPPGVGSIFNFKAFRVGSGVGLISSEVTEQVGYQRRLEALHRHAAALALAETMDAVAEITEQALNDVIEFNGGGLALVETDYLYPKYIWGDEYVEPISVRLDGPGITVFAVNSGLTQNIGDVSKDSHFVDFFTSVRIASELDVPVIVSGRVVAVVNLESEILDAYSAIDQRLVETLSSHIAAAYSKIQYNERLNALHGFTLELGLTESTKEIIETTFRIMKEVLGFQFSSFQVMEEEGLVSVGTTDDSNLGVVFPLSGKGITTRAAREGRTMLVSDVRLDPDFLYWSTDSRSELAVPILSEDSVLGVLNVENLQIDAFSDDDAKLLEVLAQNVGAALFRVRAAEERSGFESALFAEHLRVAYEQELSQLKTRFMSTATHEIRTPLTSILGYIELIDEAVQKPDMTAVTQYYQVLKRNAERLSSLTENLLDVQRMESDRIELYRSNFGVAELVSDIIKEITPLYVEKNIVFDQQIEDGLSIYADRDRIQQVLINLIVNSLKFSPDNSRIIVEVTENSKDILFTVADEGIGIDEKDLSKLFIPFPNVEPGVRGKGSGLGLSICKGIVELHDGEIWVESVGKGKGSTFSFTIPIKQ